MENYQYEKVYEKNDYTNDKDSINRVSSLSSFGGNDNQSIIERKSIMNNIFALSNSFKGTVDGIENDYIFSYNNYSHKLLEIINNYDEKIINNIESEQLKNEYYTKTNLSLASMLEKKNAYFNQFINEFIKITQQLLDKSIADDFTELNIYIEDLIQRQKDEKKKEEEYRKLKEEEMKKKMAEENYKFLGKPKKKSKIEIIGDNNLNLNNTETGVFLYDKLIIRKMTKDGMESLFPQLSETRSESVGTVTPGYPERAQSSYSLGGEPAPMLSVSNKVKFFEGGNFKSKNKISDISIYDSILEDIDFQKCFPNLEDLKFVNTKLSFNIADKIKFDKLDTLELENVGLINENFNILFEQLRRNEKMRKNLRIFSVKKNNISFLDYKKGYADNILKTMTFTNLEVLDMSYNKLYLFQNQIFNCLDSIKIIDLTNNNIVFPTSLPDLFKIAKTKKCLIFMTNNLAILKDKSNYDYNQYLIKILPEIMYPIKTITLDSIFCGYNYKDIFKLDIGKYKNSLVYLNLSNGLLRDENLIELFNSTWDFRILKTLILESNKLTENFLYAIISKDYSLDKKFFYLKVLNLSDNKISCPDVDKFSQILETFKSLQTFELKCTPFEQCINQFYKKRVMKYHDPSNKMIKEHSLNQNEEKVSQIIEQNILKDKSRATLIINDLIGAKYTKTLFTHLQNLVERITLDK